MKKILFLAILAPLIIFGCQKKGQQPEVVMIKTPTMVCRSCAKTIEKAVYRVEGVKDVSVDLEEKLVQVKFLPVQTTVAFLEGAIAAVGYDANDKKRDPEAYEKLDACCKSDKN